MRKINFEKCPVDPARFDILNIESKKKLISYGRRALRRAFRVLGRPSLTGDGFFVGENPHTSRKERG
jgi:hypothetical protein